MEIDLSKKMQEVAKRYRLSAEELAFADLVAVGWEPADAFIVAFHMGATWLKRALKAEVDKRLATEGVKARMAEVRKVLSDKQMEAVRLTSTKERNAVVDTAMSKEQMLYDLQTAVASMQVGSKEWLDTKKLIVEVTRMKQDDVQTENNTIHHFLPVRYPTGCQDCLYSRCDECRYKREYNKTGGTQ